MLKYDEPLYKICKSNQQHISKPWCTFGDYHFEDYYEILEQWYKHKMGVFGVYCYILAVFAEQIIILDVRALIYRHTVAASQYILSKMHLTL